MTIKPARFFFIASALLLLGACASEPRIIDDGQYWQRANVSETIYMRGPKAQQMLNRDIAQCVTELRELGRLGALKHAIPTDYEGRVLDPDQRDLLDWDTPERDNNLLTEHADYHNFETCMLAKGWERTMNVSYKVATRAYDNYYKAHVDYRDDTKPKARGPQFHAVTEQEGNYGNLNE